MPMIDILHDRYTYITRERNPDDEWDNDDTAADWTIRGIRVVDRGGDFEVPFEIEKGKTYFLVMADYDTGDSFGRYCNYLEFIDLFQTAEAAEAALKALGKPLTGKPGQSDWEYKYSREYVRDNGETVKVYIPWEGYFESLNDLYIIDVEAQ